MKAAFSDTYAALPNKWAVRKHTGISEPVPAARDVVWISADPESKAERQFEELSVAFRPLDTRRNQLILLDGIRRRKIRPSSNGSAPHSAPEAPCWYGTSRPRRFRWSKSSAATP